jgi:hypothetical protein
LGFGIFMEFEIRAANQAGAFEEGFHLVDAAEAWRAQVRELESQIDAGATGTALFHEYRRAVQERDALEARHEKDEQPAQQELTRCRARIAGLTAAEQGPLREPVKGELDQYVSMYETYRTYGIYRFGLEGLQPLGLAS